MSLDFVTSYRLEGFDYVRVHHNSDWSGEAIVEWKQRGESPKTDALPGRLLVKLSHAAALDWVADGVRFALNDMKEIPL